MICLIVDMDVVFANALCDMHDVIDSMLMIICPTLYMHDVLILCLMRVMVGYRITRITKRVLDDYG